MVALVATKLASRAARGMKTPMPMPMPTPTPTSKPGRALAWRHGAGWLLGVLAIVALVQFGPTREQWAQGLAAVPPEVWAVGALGLLASHGMRALRLHAEWHARVGIGRRACLRLTLVHTAAVNWLPMRGGELSYPWMLSRRWGVPWSDAALSLLWLRFQDAVVLAMFALATLVLMSVSQPWGAGLAALAALALGAGWLWTRRLGRRGSLCEPATSAAPAAAGPMTPPVATQLPAPNRLRRWRQALHEAFRQSRGGARAWSFCVANWLLKLAAMSLLLSAWTGLSLPQGLSGALGGELAAVLPLQGPAGVGTFEAGVVAGLRLADAAQAHAADAPPFGGRGAANWIGAAVAVHLLLLALSSGAALLVSMLPSGPPAPHACLPNGPPAA
jgi:hypothetical protein